MDEFESIDRYFKRAAGRDDVRLGIGDDGAVTELPPGRQLVTVLDTLVEEVHYPRELAPADIGYRAVAVNLSDIAAMGAEPAWMTLGLTLRTPDPDWLQAFADGMFAAAGRFDVALIGGDTTRGRQTVVTVQLAGFAAPGRILTRSGAAAGDAIYVSGTFGDAAAGLEILIRGENDADDYLLQRFRRPDERVSLGLALAGLASAAIDVSDGLYADLERLLQASAQRGTIDRRLLPISPALLEYCGRDRALSFALGGGDDYELCFTLPTGCDDRLAEATSGSGIPVTRIGTVEHGSGLYCTDNGKPVAYRHGGYRHF